MMIKTLIIEDEEPNIRVLKALLDKHCKEIGVLGVCKNVKSSLVEIPKMKPELIFMDIKLSDGDAFDILSKLEHRNFEIIFTSAYDQYAIKAIKFSALDYIVKPIGVEELIEAVDKALNKFNEKSFKRIEEIRYDNLLHNIKTSNGKLQRISLPSSDGHIFIEVGDIIRFEADGNYTKVYMKDKKEILVTRQLGEFEDLLNEHGFFRVHAKNLINLAYVKKYLKGKGGFVLMDDEAIVEVATRRKEDFLKVMNIH